ncbi:26S proteasome non-ATPase regulatory subunit 5-like isoform X2 [Hibiscus syriacus]|uniref:26S proteasome non-ATPase regulatory subunit 5-like isoform X2 n=1 Tax=Hibiscus syriacus TaxID=106335 RepID=A0A6A3B976_HIBSY|nr:26S proteasome non-ATPase regulatory subunit 5-like isoform X2 [Hibiscus syriacus]
MEEEFSFHDPTKLLDSASEFAHHPVAPNEAAVKNFLDRFPLPLFCSALQTKADVPGLENTLVACLERVFKTKYGTSLVPQYMPFVQVGLKADSQIVRCLSCKTVLFFLENFVDKSLSAVKLIMDYDIYPLLLDCLINGNEQVATAAIDAIKTLAQFREAMGIIFPSNINDATHLGNVASRCSSLGRVRVLSLIVKLLSISNSIASVIYSSNLLSLLEADIRNSNDTLVTLSALELLYELTEIQHGAEFLARNTLQLLHSIISNSSMESILRSRAMMISGRLLSKENIYMFVDEPSAKSLISAIDVRLGLLDGQDADERESALEALGGIGSSIQGAVFLLTSFPSVARHIVHAAFDGQGGGKQLAALHALGNIVGENRPDGSIILNGDAEERLRRLIYEVASESTKLTPSGLFLSVLQQAAEIRLAGYRVLTGLVARVWCLMEICSKPEIISIVTDPTTETAKIGMEARYNCCKAIHRSFMSSKLASDPALSGTAGKLQEGVERGPYLVRKNNEATPVVMTAERF